MRHSAGMGIGADHQQACRSQRCTRGARSVRRHAVALGAPPSAWGRGGLGRAAPGGAPALAQRRGGHSCSCWQLCWGCESGRLCTQDRALLTIPTLTGSWMRTRAGTRPWTWSSTRVPPSRPSKPRMGPSPDAEVPAQQMWPPKVAQLAPARLQNTRVASAYPASSADNGSEQSTWQAARWGSTDAGKQLDQLGCQMCADSPISERRGSLLGHCRGTSSSWAPMASVTTGTGGMEWPPGRSPRRSGSARLFGCRSPRIGSLLRAAQDDAGGQGTPMGRDGGGAVDGPALRRGRSSTRCLARGACPRPPTLVTSGGG